MTTPDVEKLLDKLDEFDDIYIDCDDDEINVQAFEYDAEEVREVLDELEIDYEESDFWQCDMCGTNFCIQL